MDGKTLRSEPVTIRVVEGRTGADATAAASGRFFVRAEPATGEAYIGQQIWLDYKLYTTIDIESYNILEESDYPGFYAEDLKRTDGRVMREVVDGTSYTTKVLKRVALFPQQAGLLTVDALQIQLGIVEEGSRPNSFFFNRQIKLHKLRAHALHLVLDGRANVVGRHQGAHALGRGAGLQAGDAGANDKHLGRHQRAGRGHHQGKNFGQCIGRQQDTFVARQAGQGWFIFFNCAGGGESRLE